MTIAAAASVPRASHSHVSLTQPLGLDSGCHHFALQKAAAAKVSGEKKSLTFHLLEFILVNTGGFTSPN